MKLWRFTEPIDHRFARAVRAGGTWQPGEYELRNRNLRIEWLSGSDVVGDFTWPGLDTDLVVTDRVRDFLRVAGVPGVELRAVEVQESSKRGSRRSTNPKGRWPYYGQALHDFWITAWIAMDRERSTFTEVVRDSGARHLELIGAETREDTWDPQQGMLVPFVQPRVEGRGLFVPHLSGVFRVKEFPAWMFCTDDVKAQIEQYGFTNVSFLEMGDVLDQ